jgi:heme A synthase
MTTLRRGATAAYRWVTLLFAVAVLVQFVLAGAGVFGFDAGTSLDDQSSLDPHRALGNALGVAAIVLLLLLLVARPTRHVFIPYLALIALTIVQMFLGAGSGELRGALHGLVAIVIFSLAGYLGHRAFRREVTAR